MKRANSPRRPQGRRGFAMLEALVAVLLFSLGILGLFGLQAHAIQYSVEAEARSRAALLANEVSTTMWLQNSVAVNTAAGTSWDAKAKAALPAGSIVVAAVNSATVPNSADITINWEPPQRRANEPKASRLTTRVTLPPP